MEIYNITSTRLNASKYSDKKNKCLEFHIRHSREHIYQYIIHQINSEDLRLYCNQQMNAPAQMFDGEKKQRRKCLGKVSVRPINNVIIVSGDKRKEARGSMRAINHLVGTTSID